MSVSLTITLDRADSRFRRGDMVTGVVTLSRTLQEPGPQASACFSCSHVRLLVRAATDVQLSARVGLLDALCSVAPRVALERTLVLSQAGGHVLRGSAPLALPFRFALDAPDLLETYSGAYVRTSCSLVADAKVAPTPGGSPGHGIGAILSAFRTSTLRSRAAHLLVSVPSPPHVLQAAVDAEPVAFCLANADADADVSAGSALFRVSGSLHSLYVAVTEPIVGHVRVDEETSADASVLALRLRLLRVERVELVDDGVGGGSGVASETTEVSCVQLADGDVCRGLDIPIRASFPRGAVCANVVCEAVFDVSFVARIEVAFADGTNAHKDFQIVFFTSS